MTLRLLLLGIAVGVTAAAAWLMPQLARQSAPFDVALRLIADGRAGEAVYLFDDPAWRGVAEYRAGRYRRALGEFIQNETVLTLYNIGNAYAKLQEWTGAKAAYRKALRLDPAHEDARHNLALVLRAEELEQRLLEEGRTEEQLGRWSDGNREQRQRGSGDGKRVEQGDKTEGDKRPANLRVGKGGASDQPGLVGEKALSDTELGGPAGGMRAGDRRAEGRSGAPSLAIQRESAQKAEILLREITDDPARVLAARLRMAHRLRLEREGRCAGC